MLDLSRASGLFTIYYSCIGCFTLRLFMDLSRFRRSTVFERSEVFCKGIGSKV